MIPCRSSIQRWQTTGLDSAFGIRQADTRRRTNPLERPSPRRRWEVPASTPADATASPPARRSAWRGVCRRVARPTGIGPHSPRSLRLSDRVSTSSPGAWETAGRRWPSSRAVEWMVPGRAAHSANAGPAFGKAPGPRHPRRSEGMSVRGRTMARGTAACRRGETCTLGCRGYSAPAGEPAARPRAARRCSSRERGDWPGPAGRACTGGRRQGRGEALQHGRDRRRNPVPGAQGGGGRARHRYRMRPRAETGIIGSAATRQSPGASRRAGTNWKPASSGPDAAGDPERPAPAFQADAAPRARGRKGQRWAETVAPAPPSYEFRSRIAE